MIIFSKSDGVSSAAFDDFRDNRIIVANRLAIAKGIDIGNPANLDADETPSLLVKEVEISTVEIENIPELLYDIWIIIKINWLPVKTFGR